MGRTMRKTLNLMLAVALGVGGLMSQAAGTSAAAAARAGNGAISDNGLRSLLAELTPETFAEAAGTLAAPLLDPLPALTNEESIVVAGSALADAEVTVTYSVYNGPIVEEAAITADASGRFNYLLQLSYDGVYQITAKAELGGESSEASVPAIIEVDRTPPEWVEDESWEPAYPPDSAVWLHWSPPQISDGGGGTIADPSVIGYRIYDRATGNLLKETVATEAILDQLAPASAYSFRIRAFDTAGNESNDRLVYAGTSPAGEVKLTNAQFAGTPLLIGDGSAVLYVTAEEPQLHRIDIATGTDEVLGLTADGGELNGDLKELAANRSGSLVAFSSNATNLAVASPPDGARYAVYVYDADSGELRRVSNPALQGGQPSLDEAGERLVFAEGGQIYEYDLVTGAKSLVSHTEDHAPANGSSRSPVISGDGSRIAYITTSTDLQGASDPDLASNIAVYDIALAAHIWISGHVVYGSGLRISNDGRYVAMSASEGSWRKVYAIDLRDNNPDNWSDDYFPDNRNSNDRKDKNYNEVSMSGDGRYVLVQLYDNNPQGGVYLYEYAERFDRETGLVDRVGNPAMGTWNAQIDGDGNRVLYERDGEMYTYCYGECRQSQSGDTIRTASWSVQSGDLTSDSVNPGSAVTIMASGNPGLEMVADIAYREMMDGDPSQTRAASQTVEMTETPVASGLYRAIFAVAEGMTQIDAITARLPGSSAAKSAANLPLAVAGKLAIDVVTEYPDVLGSAWFDLHSSNTSTTRKPLTAGVTHYEYWWPDDPDLELVLTAVNGAELARKSGIAVNKGAATSVSLSAAPIVSSLTVRVSARGQPAAAQVQFMDEGGTTIARIPTDEQGAASLSERHAGERIRVAVAPSSEYKAPPEQAVTLAIGGSELLVPLQQLSEVYTLEYAREAGSGNDKAPAIGSDAVLTVQSPAGHQVRAKLGKSVWQDDGSEADAEEWVALTESADVPGSYSGTFRIAEGTSKLNEFSLEMDGALLPQTYPIQRPIAGRLRVAIDAPPNTEGSAWLKDANLSVMHIGFPYEVSNQRVDDQARIYTFDVPYANSEYQVFLSSNRSSGGLLYTTSPGHGQTGEATVVPLFPFEFRLNVKKDGENGGVYQATLRHSVSREILWSGSFNDTTTAKVSLPRREAAPEPLELTIAATDPAYEKETIGLLADVPSRSLDVTLRKKPEALIRGRILGTDGKPAAGSTVTAMIGSDGLSKSYTARADATGAYSLRVAAGTVRLRAQNTGGSGSLSEALTMEASGEHTVDLQLKELAAVTLRLYTRLGGGNWEGPIELDSATTNHLNVFPSFSYTKQQGATYRAWAAVGDTVGLCVYGVEAGLPKMCRESIVGEDNKADIEIRLENAGGQASFRAYEPNGTLLKTIYATLYDLNDNAIWENLLIFDPERQQFILPVDSGGSKRLMLRAPYAKAAASVAFTARPGGIVALGDIRMQPAGDFNGAGNGLEAGADWTTPGGRITLRATYKNTSLLDWGQAKDAVLALEWPKEVEFAPGTLVLNGKAVEPRLSGRTLEVPLGDIARQTGGSMQLQLKIGNEAGAPQIAIVGKMKYKDAGQQAQEQIFGTAVLSVTPVTMRAPEIVANPRFEVNGFAPAESEVTVYDDGVAVGKTKSSSVGTWTLPIELNDSAARKHRLTTEAETGGVRSPGERAVVIYDPNDPGLASISMQQQQGRLVTFDPANGVAVFPYVVVPGRPFVFELTFRDVSRITDVYVQAGDSAAQAQLVNGRYQAVLPFTSNLGAVSVDYHKKPEADVSPEALPTEEAFRDSLPPAVADYGLEWKAGPGQKTPDGIVMPAGTGSMQVRLNRDMTAKLTVRTERSDYTPTGRDLEQAAYTGVSVYDFAVSKSETASSKTLRVTGYVPEGSDESAPGRGGRRTIAGLGPKEALVKKTIEIVVGITGDVLTWRDLIQGTMDVADPDSFERRINRAIEEAEQICDEKAREYYLNFAWEVKADIFMHNMLKTGIGIASITFIPGGLFGIAFWGESYYIGLKLDEVANNELTELENHLRDYNSELCKRKSSKPPVADPKYIWDPSGYVYEGMPNNRVEGATATALEQDRATGEWNVWDAEWYGQTSRLTTDAQGRYGWDVPEGKWKVKYEKEGYATTYSDELEVPPPQLEVNVPLVSYAAPRAERAKAAPGGKYVDVYFSKPIDVASILSDAISVAFGAGGGLSIPGTVQAVNPVEANGKQLANVIRYAPAEALADGTYQIAVSEELISYAGIPVEPGAALRVSVSRNDGTPPDEAENLTVGVTLGKASIMWSDPSDDDFAKAYIRWKKAGDSAYGSPIEVGRGTGWAQIVDLPAATGYDFKVTTVDESGNESSGVTASWTAAADWQAPLAVAGLQAVGVTDGKIVLKWIDPASEDLAKLRLAWGKADRPDASEGEALPGAESFTIPGLAPATDYTVSIFAVDRSGNESSGTTLTVRTKSASTGSNGGSGGIGGVGGGTANGDSRSDDSNAAERIIGAEGGSIEAFDGWVTLTAEPGAYSAETTVTLRRGAEPDRPLAAGYTRMTETLGISAAGSSAPGKPLLLSIRLDPAVSGKTDARKLGLYKQDAASPSGWTYMGGILEKEILRVTAPISSYGTYAVLLYERSFADLASHWSRDEVSVLVSRHLVEGVSADRFDPNRSITRAEVTKLLVGAMQSGQVGTMDNAITGPQSSAFRDVPEGAWYASYVRKAVGLGLVFGDNGRFRPNDPVTREELAVLLQRFAEMQGFASSSPAEEASDLDRYADARNVSGWAREAVALAVRQRWMQGMTETELKPHGQASRAQAASLLLRLLTSLGVIEQ